MRKKQTKKHFIWLCKFRNSLHSFHPLFILLCTFLSFFHVPLHLHPVDCDWAYVALLCKHTTLWFQGVHLRLGWRCCEAEFRVCPVTIKEQIFNQTVPASHLFDAKKTSQENSSNIMQCWTSLTEGWSFQPGWPWAGSWYPGWTRWTRPRKNTGFQIKPGSEAGTTYDPHDSKDTSSGSWKQRQGEKGGLDETMGW